MHWQLVTSTAFCILKATKESEDGDQAYSSVVFQMLVGQILLFLFNTSFIKSVILSSLSVLVGPKQRHRNLSEYKNHLPPALPDIFFMGRMA